MSTTKEAPKTTEELPVWYGQLDIPATRQQVRDYCDAYEAKIKHYNQLLKALRDADKAGERIREEQRIRQLYGHFLCKAESDKLNKMVLEEAQVKREELYRKLKRQRVAQQHLDTMINLVNLYSRRCAQVRENRLDPRVPFTATNGALAEQRNVKCEETIINHRQRLMEAGLIDYRFRGTKAPGEYRINTALVVPKSTPEETIRHLSEAARQHPEQPRFLPGTSALHRTASPGLVEKFGDNEAGNRDGDLKKKNERSGRTPAAREFSRSAVRDLVAQWEADEKQQARSLDNDGDRDRNRDGDDGNREDGDPGARSGPARRKMDTAGAGREIFAEPKASELLRQLASATTAEEKRHVELHHFQRLALHILMRILYPGKEYPLPVLQVTLSHIEHFFNHTARDHRPKGKFHEFQQVVQHRRYYLDLNPQYFQVAPQVWTNPKHANHIASAVEYYRNKVQRRRRNDKRYYSHLHEVPQWVSRYFETEDGQDRGELVRQAENRLGAHRTEGDTRALQLFYDCIAAGPQTRKHLPYRNRYTGA